MPKEDSELLEEMECAFSVDYIDMAQKMVSGILGASNPTELGVFKGKEAFGIEAILPVSITEQGVLLCRAFESPNNIHDDVIIDLQPTTKIFLLSDIHLQDKDLLYRKYSAPRRTIEARVKDLERFVEDTTSVQDILVVVGDWFDIWQATLFVQPLARRVKEEFAATPIAQQTPPIKDCELVAGARMLTQYGDLLKCLSDRLYRVIYIPGNHDRAFAYSAQLRNSLKEYKIVTIQDCLIGGSYSEYKDFLSEEFTHYLLGPLQQIIRARLRRYELPFPFMHIYHGHEFSKFNRPGVHLGFHIARAHERTMLEPGLRSVARLMEKLVSVMSSERKNIDRAAMKTVDLSIVAGHTHYPTCFRQRYSFPNAFTLKTAEWSRVYLNLGSWKARSYALMESNRLILKKA